MKGTLEHACSISAANRNLGLPEENLQRSLQKASFYESRRSLVIWLIIRGYTTCYHFLVTAERHCFQAVPYRLSWGLWCSKYGPRP